MGGDLSLGAVFWFGAGSVPFGQIGINGLGGRKPESAQPDACYLTRPHQATQMDVREATLFCCLLSREQLVDGNVIEVHVPHCTQ